MIHAEIEGVVPTIRIPELTEPAITQSASTQPGEAELKNNPEWLRQACENLNERLGKLYILQAESWVLKGQPQQAVHCLERVLKGFPGTRQADQAQTRLAQLQGQPVKRTEFKK
jgi:predicted Zn-dependent protease